MKRLFYHIILLALVGVSCTTTQNLQQLNLAHLYQEEGVVLKPKFRIYHESKDSSRVYFEGSSDQLLYIKQDNSNEYKAEIGIKYRLYSNYNRDALIDSGSTRITDVKTNTDTKIIWGNFELKYPKHTENEKYLLEVKLIDLHRNLSYMDLILVDRSDIQSNQQFLLTTPKGRVIFQNHYPLNVPFLLTHNSNPKQYIVRYYNRDFPVASTPYARNIESSFKYKSDSIFYVNASDTLTLTLPGFYHFQLNESTKNGFTVFSFYQEYPLITRRAKLGAPLRYITTNDEFDAIMKEDEKQMKLEVDKFWLGLAGNVDRGKILVSTYYNRVEAANMYFTSYLEGWKTDRGIIYVILGPPSEVNRNEYQEQWIYGDPTSSLTYVYTFTLISNPFCNNDYALNRSSSYKYGWAQAIETWRKGRPFGIKEIKQAQDERDRQVRVNSPPYFWY